MSSPGWAEALQPWLARKFPGPEWEDARSQAMLAALEWATHLQANHPDPTKLFRPFLYRETVQAGRRGRYAARGRVSVEEIEAAVTEAGARMPAPLTVAPEQEAQVAFRERLGRLPTPLVDHLLDPAARAMPARLRKQLSRQRALAAA